MTHKVVAAVTARIVERSRATREAYLTQIGRRAGLAAGARQALLRQLGPRLRRPARGRQAEDARPERAQPRDRDRLQRHAVGAPTLRALSRANPHRRARGRGDRPGRRRHPRHVRRRHPGPSGHGAEPVQPRPDRHVGRDRAEPRRLRRRAVPGNLRQDRPGPGHRGAGLRPPARGVRAVRPDGERPLQRREGPHPSPLRRRQGRARRAPGVRAEELPRPRHLHLLRHGQLQPDADGDHGLAPAGAPPSSSPTAPCATP